MDPTVQATLLASAFGLIGVVVGAVIGLAGSLLSSRYLMRKQQEQWEREREAEREKWLRDKLQEIYANCIYYSYPVSYHVSAYTYLIQNKDAEADVEYNNTFAKILNCNFTPHIWWLSHTLNRQI